MTLITLLEVIEEFQWLICLKLQNNNKKIL